MHFGRLPSVDGIEFSLPNDTARTARLLNLEKKAATNVYVGCSLWASRHWVGHFYPTGTAAHSYLREYALRYKSVEVNSTFYHLLDGDRLAQWRHEVPSDFRFCPKVFRGITEDLGASDMPRLLERFCASMRALGENLGLVFAQFSETFTPKMSDALAKFVELWPKDLPLAIELRHPNWFQNHSLSDELINFFYRHDIATVITDTPGRRDVLHTSLTQPKVLIRFQGNELHPSDRRRLADWAERLKIWANGSLREIYFFAHQPEELNIPETAYMLLEELARREVVPAPQFWGRGVQQLLF